MLLWELLSNPIVKTEHEGSPHPVARPIAQRLPYDNRCCVITRSGRRCRGRIRRDSEFCPLHDPAVVERRQTAGTRARRNRLTHLPDGYLRKLSTKAAVGNAMDRLYREVRLGIITPEMGAVLFEVLVRLLDSGLLEGGKVVDAARRRGKADRLRPTMKEWFTRAERLAWKKAVARAPASVVAHHAGCAAPPERPMKLPLQAAS